MFDTFVRITELDSRKRLQCNQCRRETIHQLEAQCLGQWAVQDDFGNAADGGSEFSLYRCGACDAVCFERSVWNSETADHDQDGRTLYIRDEVQYPPPSSSDFAFATDFIPRDLYELIDEMIYALAGMKLKLATVALRMIVEFIVTDKECAGKTLADKIDDLGTKGHVDTTQLALLHKIRQKGNAGAHERVPMNRNEMVAGIGIINLLLEKLYNGPARQAEIIRKANHAFGSHLEASVTNGPSPII